MRSVFMCVADQRLRRWGLGHGCAQQGNYGERTPRCSETAIGGFPREAPVVKFTWIAEKADYTVAESCRALHVSRSGFDAWQDRPPSAHAQRDAQLRVLIRASHEGSRRRYGRPRIQEDLREQGEHVSEKRVARLMRVDGLREVDPETWTAASVKSPSCFRPPCRSWLRRSTPHPASADPVNDAAVARWRTDRSRSALPGARRVSRMHEDTHPRL